MLSTTEERLEVNHSNNDPIIFCFLSSPIFTKKFTDCDVYQDLISIYFPGDEWNTGSTESVTCVDDNLSDSHS